MLGKIDMRALLRSVLFVVLGGFALQSLSAQAPVCPDRPAPGSPVQNPLDLYSQNGILTVNLTLQNQLFLDGFMHYCYVYMYQGQQIEAPTLRLDPGDQLVLNLTDNIQAPFDRETKHLVKHMTMTMGHMHEVANKHGKPGPDDPCDGGPVLQSSTNMHFHGLNVPPVCHQDDVINTIIQSGDPSFQYSIQIPANEPAGLYWYHPPSARQHFHPGGRRGIRRPYRGRYKPLGTGTDRARLDRVVSSSSQPAPHRTQTPVLS